MLGLLSVKEDLTFWTGDSLAGRKGDKLISRLLAQRSSETCPLQQRKQRSLSDGSRAKSYAKYVATPLYLALVHASKSLQRIGLIRFTAVASIGAQNACFPNIQVSYV